MIYIWTAITFLPMSVIFFRYFRGNQIADGSLLLFGLIFYCFLPFFIYGSKIYESGPGASTWLDTFKPLYEASLIAIFLFCFYIGSFLIGKMIPTTNFFVKLNRPISHKTLMASFLFLTLLWFVFTYIARNNLFRGYASEYNPAILGPLATLNLVLNLFILNIKQWMQSKAALTLYLILLSCNSILLLSMGGRMYVITALVSLTIQHINNENFGASKRSKFFLIICSSILLLLFIGVWRGGSSLDFSTLLFLGVAEPVLTSTSMAYMFSCEKVALFSFPYNFTSSIINIIPSALMPDKATYLFDLDQSRGCLFTPFGATHITASMLLNFGILGSSIYLIFFSALLKSLKYPNTNGWWLYYYVCGILPFLFFREGFNVFNKILIGGGFIMAIAITVLDRLKVK